MNRFTLRTDRLVWILFLLWTSIGFFVMPWNPGSMQIAAIFPNPAHQDLVMTFLKLADGVWIMLAAFTMYFWMVRHEGLHTARLQAALTIVASAVVEWIGQDTGWPFGPYFYTANFGPLIAGKLPVAIPLAWLVIVICSCALMRCTPLCRSRFTLAPGAALLATLTDLNLEPVAWRVRGYWLWYPGQDNPPSWPPLQNYASWFILSFLLVLALPGIRSALPEKSWLRPAIVLGSINLLLALTHIAYLLRG